MRPRKPEAESDAAGEVDMLMFRHTCNVLLLIVVNPGMSERCRTLTVAQLDERTERSHRRSCI